MFHKEGFKIILVSFAITVIIALIAHYCIDIEWLKLLVQLVAFQSRGLPRAAPQVLAEGQRPTTGRRRVSEGRWSCFTAGVPERT